MLLKFFLTCNKIGAFTLGGGYAMIPIMEREFVDKNRWMNKDEAALYKCYEDKGWRIRRLKKQKLPPSIFSKAMA